MGGGGELSFSPPGDPGTAFSSSRVLDSVSKYLRINSLNSPLNSFFSRMYNPFVAGYKASDVHPKIDC